MWLTRPESATVASTMSVPGALGGSDKVASDIWGVLRCRADLRAAAAESPYTVS